jgi:hypothetical protein
MNNIIFSSLLASGIVFINSVMAATPTATVDLETGAEYDSNLSVIELDQNSAAGDWAMLFNARANTQWQATEKIKMKGGLSYNNKTYQDNSAFDLAIKQAFVDGSYSFQPLTAGLSYHYADAALDSRDFLTLQQRSVYLSRLFNQTIFVRAAINDQDKDFPTSGERNASNHSVNGDVFLFFQQGKTFITLGITDETENASANEFDFDGTSFRASLSHQFLLGAKNNRVQAGWRYDDRDYSAITPALETKRQDKRNVTTLEWHLEANSWLSLVGKVERGDYDSNLDSANYSETIGSLMLKASF